MFDAVDARDSARVLEIDHNEVDPLFDDIEARVFAAADRHGRLANEGIEVMRRANDVGLVSIIVGILVSWALVAVLWRVLQNYQRSIRDSSTREIEASRLNERRTRALIEKSRDVFFLCDVSGKLRFANHALQAHWGHDVATFCRGSIHELVHPDDRPTFALAWKDVMLSETAHLLLEVRTMHADGRVCFTNVSLQNFVGDSAVQGIVVTLHDVSERRALEQELSHQAFHDSLTGLANRALFKDRVEHAIARAKRGGHYVGLLYLDLDNFKAINDGMGHASGDQLLRQVAERLGTCIRPGDTLARLGGDEFTILLEDIDEPSVAVSIADRALRSLADPMTVLDRVVYIGCSVGIVVRRAESESQDDLLRDADLALYKAKAEGRGRFALFEPGLRAAAVDHLALERDLRSAIRLGQIQLVYQPIILLEDGAMVEVEALMRWTHGEQGQISPAIFIPLAEKSGYIVELGLWGLEQACQTVGALHESLSDTMRIS